MNLNNKFVRNSKLKVIYQSNKKKNTKGKISEDNKQIIPIDIIDNNSKNKNRNYYRKLLSQNFDDSSIIKKLNNFKKETSNLDYLTTEYLEIKEKLIGKKDKLKDFEKLISQTEFFTIDNSNYENLKKKYNFSQEKENQNNNIKRINKTIENNKQNNESYELKNENIKLKQEINELKIKIETIKEEYFNEKTERKIQINNLKEKLKKFENERVNNNSIEKETIYILNNEKEKISLKLKDAFEENNQKNSIIKKLNDCIIEYNKTIIESKNELSQRDEQIEKLIKEKNKLIGEKDKLLNQIIQNQNDSINLNSHIQKLVKENEIKNNKITSLTSIIKNLQNEKQISELTNQKDSNKINSTILTFKQTQIELNNKILILTKNNNEKEKIIKNLNQNINFYKIKYQENQKKINTFIENLKDMKKYVIEFEKMIINNYNKQNNEILMSKKTITERTRDTKTQLNSQKLKLDNIDDDNNNDYNNYLLDSLRNMIVNIDTKLQDNV